MHPATVNAISGMLAVIRQTLIGIEAVLSAEDVTRIATVNQIRDELHGSGEESRYTTPREDELVAKMLGLNDGDQ